ncbi:hypothetical protein DTO282F9_6705 [Paecilomyces variotii]|nr:hypothetical protein DTO282F9_6705 [Paecilomyces variotii]
MADYSQYATPAAEWVEFQKTLPPAVPPTATVFEARDAFNASRAKAHKEFYGVADDVQIDEFTISTPGGSSIPARLYRPKKTGKAPLPLYIRYHSGGWHLGTLETEAPYCAHLCSTFTKTDPTGVGIAILHPLYHPTPEYAFPTQPEESWAAFELFASEGSEVAAKYGLDTNRVYLGGTSAGANLSIGIAVREMRRIQKLQQDQGSSAPRPVSRVKGLVLTAPPTVHPDLFPYHLLANRQSSSLVQNADAPLLPMSRLNDFVSMYLPNASEETKADERLSFLIIPDEEFDKELWPPTTFHIAGMDPLRDEGLLFAEKLNRIGVETKVTVYTGFPHAFNLYPQLKEAAKWREATLEQLRWLLGKQ